MTKLSDTQRVILSAAAQRDDHNILPLPGSLRGGAVTKVVGALLSRGLIAETATDSQTKADASLNRIWRNDENGRAILLHITDAGLAAIGIEPEVTDSAPADNAATVKTREAASAPKPNPKIRKPRTGTKQAMLVAMLKRPEGATIQQIAEANQWELHTVRGAISGVLKKKLGLAVTSEKAAGSARIYRIER